MSCHKVPKYDSLLRPLMYIRSFDRFVCVVFVALREGTRAQSEGRDAGRVHSREGSFWKQRDFCGAVGSKRRDELTTRSCALTVLG